MTDSLHVPTFPADFPQLLQSAQDSGSLFLVDLDEAEIRACGAPELPRVGTAAWSAADDPSAIEAAGRRLVARGLARWEPPRCTPIGTLAGYWHLLLHPKTRLGFVASRLEPEPTPAVRRQLRICVLIDVVRGGLAMVEQSDLTIPAPAGPIPVRVEILRLDVLVERVVALAYAPSTSAARVTDVLFADARRRQVLSKLTAHPADGSATLQAPRQAILGPRISTTAVARGDFADHLRSRLMAAG